MPQDKRAESPKVSGAAKALISPHMGSAVSSVVSAFGIAPLVTNGLIQLSVGLDYKWVPETDLLLKQKNML